MVYDNIAMVNSHEEQEKWSTTNSEYHNNKGIDKFSKRNFKRKTPFSQWQDAYFGNGVFFNAPVNGI